MPKNIEKELIEYSPLVRRLLFNRGILTKKEAGAFSFGKEEKKLLTDPLSDNNPLLKPEQIDVPPLTEPFTVTGDTSILTGVKVPDGHVPL